MSNVVRTGLRGLGQTLMTLGVVVLLFCVYELYFTGWSTAQDQRRLGGDLRSAWAEPPPRPQPGRPQALPVSLDLGRGFAVLHIPSLPDHDPWVVVEGVSVDDLKKGPGHIPGTALPGQVGNVVISGHRTTYGAPFNRLDELTAGDEVVLETRDRWFTYTVQEKSIVAPTAVEVTLPVPGRPLAEPVEKLLTLTTCHPKYSAKQRLIVRANLTAESDKDEGPTPALRG